MKPSLLKFRSSPWLRRLAALLALSFALGAVAHAGHTHDPKAAAGLHAVCGYCVSFDNVADAPAQSAIVAPAPSGAAVGGAGFTNAVGQQPQTSAQARAPPSC